jgi:hypothetical protein
MVGWPWGGEGLARNNPAVSLEESALLDALRRGDEDAFARLVGEHHATTYLEGALPPEERDRFEAHLQGCSGGQTHVSQARLVVSTLGQLQLSAGEDLSAEQGRILELFRTRGLHRREKPDRDIPLGLGSELAALGDHIAYFWESEREFDATAGFLAAGASLGEACVLIGHDAAHERLLASLERRGLSVPALMQERQLQVASVRSSADGGTEGYHTEPSGSAHALSDGPTLRSESPECRFDAAGPDGTAGGLAQQAGHHRR